MMLQNLYSEIWFGYLPIFLLGFSAWFLLFREPKNWKLLNSKLPGPPKLPLLGNALALNVPNHRKLIQFPDKIKFKVIKNKVLNKVFKLLTPKFSLTFSAAG